MEERLIVLFSVSYFFLALSSCVQIDHLYFEHYLFPRVGLVAATYAVISWLFVLSHSHTMYFYLDSRAI